MREINKIVIHHTGSRILRGLDSPALVKFRHKLRGWDNIGYHYLIGNGKITGDGRVYTGRPIDVPGAHTLGHNADSLGIALIGNYNTAKPTENQLNSLAYFLMHNCERFGISPEDVYGHNELVGSTSCPGKNIDMAQIRETLKRGMDGD